ncbi:MAG: sigma-70 family RNA polymerase sigma factor [Spirochaetales bacterium]|nr:sigma-70 family RNA polymerase sigma factor [Spirochaetales bacterium]
MGKITRSNEDWLAALSQTGQTRDRALRDLRYLLLKGLNLGFRGQPPQKDREFHALFEDFVQDAMITILEHLADFKGNSRFTTWAHKICLRKAFSELRRRRWKDVSLQSMVDMGHEPEAKREDSTQAVHTNTMMEWLHKVMNDELSEKQRIALQAVALQGMPLEEVARRMDSNRNSLYKLLHDARLKLKKCLERDGFSTGMSP